MDDARGDTRGERPRADEHAAAERTRLLDRLRVERGRAAAAHAFAVIHKGYIATPAYDAAAGVYRARAEGLTRDAIAAEGATAHEAAMRFWRAVDRYLDDCAARGRAPEPPGGTKG